MTYLRPHDKASAVFSLDSQMIVCFKWNECSSFKVLVLILMFGCFLIFFVMWPG